MTKKKKPSLKNPEIKFFFVLLIWAGLSYQGYPFQSKKKEQKESHKVQSEQVFGEEHILGDTSLLELPRLSGEKEDYFITHRVENGKQINYSIEYHTPLRHARWVCFSFDKKTVQKRVKRTKGAWAWNPFIPTKFETTRRDFRNFDRGHLVASNDRSFSREANSQTFYYSNMSPQRSDFNQKAWHQLENKVLYWARSRNFMDKMYIAKGGTIREGEYEDRLANRKIAVPKHYWIAIVAQKGTKWYGLSFWISHTRNHTQKGSLLPLTCSIDELEKRTGLDFFFNLPDAIEKDVEQQNPKDFRYYWKRL